jgi:putative transposase
VKLLAKAHQAVKCQRQDVHHNVALKLVRQYDTIYWEALQTANMLKNHRLAKSISDAGWSAFVSVLTFKAAYAGKQAVAVPPAFTSQMCAGPNCGRPVWKGLSVRRHACSACGTELHRDHNAAPNILALGKNPSGAGQAPAGVNVARWGERRLKNRPA